VADFYERAGKIKDRLDSDDRIILIRVKIERAKKHLRNLQDELISFGKREFHAVTTDNNLQIRQLGKYRMLPFDALPAAGDVIHNLRSALDHLACQLVWVGSGEEPSRRIEFPIAKDAATYEREKARKVEGMCPNAVKAIDALKPYKGGNDALWRIHELDNIDKHRTLFTYANDCFLYADWMSEYGSGPYNIKASSPHFGGIGVFDDEVEKRVEFEIDEAVTRTTVAKGGSLLPSLTQLIDYVDKLVLGFKPFLE
jgi:hypothetical protein